MQLVSKLDSLKKKNYNQIKIYLIILYEECKRERKPPKGQVSLFETNFSGKRIAFGQTLNH